MLSSVGVEQAGESANAAHYEYLDRKLRESKSRWKICVWHMTMGEMQVSYKGDSVGWGAYEICRKHGAFIVTGHAHTYSRTHEMARFGTKRYGHTKQDLVVSHEGDNRVHLSSGENGTTGVAVVGIGGYKNEEQLRGGNHWAKIYSSECLPGDDACEFAPKNAKFGALMCDFNDFRADAEAECWTVTTVGKNATRRRKRQSYRNPVDRFFLVSGPRSVGSKDGRPEVFINDAAAAVDDASDEDVMTTNKSRGLKQKKMNPNRRSLKRSNCTDVVPPASGGVYYTCEQQKQWGKCDSWFMKNGKYCDMTCGRCVEIYEDLSDDYQDYEVEEENEEEEEFEEKKTRAGDVEDTDDGDAMSPVVAPAQAPATAPAPAPDIVDLFEDDATVEKEEEEKEEEEGEENASTLSPAPGPTNAADEDEDGLMANVDFAAMADEIFADDAY